MNRRFVTLMIIIVSLSSCSTDTSFKIGKDTVGPLTRETQVSQLKTIFVNDSLVDDNGGTEFTGTTGDIIVYEKGGKKLLQLSLDTASSNSKVKFIQVFDSRYLTEEGVGLSSTFKNIQEAYKIKRIDNLIGTIVIFVNEGDEYFTIDKKHLSANLMFDTETTIEATQIPDDAPIKYFWIGW